MEAEKIAAGLSERDRQWIADWPEASLSEDWSFTGRDTGASWQRMWRFRDLGCLVAGRRLRNAVYYKWTDLGRAVAALAKADGADRVGGGYERHR
jgi:hypothetical protein